ncbi:MAG: hypothetical protein M1493_06820, partial [Firmicutes bacterium]|nr:hypothetical protein [Bacillota bacterium]
RAGYAAYRNVSHLARLILGSHARLETRMPLKACQTSEITAKSLGDTVFVVFFAMVWYVRQENCGTEPLPEGTERQGFRTVPAVSSMPICFALGAAEGKFSLRMNREATHAVTAKPVAKFLGLGERIRSGADGHR